MRLDEVKDLAPQDERQGIQKLKIEGGTIAKGSNDTPEPPDMLPDKKDFFFIDLDGERHITSISEARSVDVSRSPSVSDSSEDEVVFTGRSNYWGHSRHSHHRSLETSPVSATVANTASEIGTPRDELHFTITQKFPRRKTTCKEPSLLAMPIGDGQSANETTKLNKKMSRRRRRRHRNDLLEDEAEIIADYIANMDKDEESLAAPSTESLTSEDSPNVDDVRGPGSLTPGGLRYLEDMHISDDPPSGNMEEGPKSLPMKCDPWEDNQSQSMELDDEGSAGLVGEELSDARDDISDNELDSESSEDLLPVVQEHPFAERGRKSKRSRKQNLTSAPAFTDALEQDSYPGFDIMDFDRPSLRKKSKSSRHVTNFGLSDSDLELQLERAWENDRSKKKARKQQREQLRSQGLLGRKTEKTDSKAKYALGMSMEDLKAEVKAFLLSSSERYV